MSCSLFTEAFEMGNPFSSSLLIFFHDPDFAKCRTGESTVSRGNLSRDEIEDIQGHVTTEVDHTAEEA